MKARWPMKCECCREAILTGSQYVMLHGRPWKPKHALAYQAQRRAIAASGQVRR